MRKPLTCDDMFEHLYARYPEVQACRMMYLADTRGRAFKSAREFIDWCRAHGGKEQFNDV